MPRYLTKSRFKLALECTTKLYYTDKREYPDKKLEDDFLKALANGGFQVGALAKCYFKGGIEVESSDHDEAVQQTNVLLRKESVTIFEGAFRYQNLFIRADVVVKSGNKLKLYEVKAKSWDPLFDSFTKKKEGIRSEWKEYIYDVAFQKYVITKAHPEFEVDSFLMLADKSTRTTFAGLNQVFFLEKGENGRTRIVMPEDIHSADLGTPILTPICVDEAIASLLSDALFGDRDKTFMKSIHQFAENYEKDLLLQQPLGKQCTKCEFDFDNSNPTESKSLLKNGFKECWKREAKFTEEDFNTHSILKIWDFRKKPEYIQKGFYFQHQLTRTDLEPKTSRKSNIEPGLSRIDRQELQITKSKNRDTTPWIDKEGLQDAFDQFVYPLHFIDFETTAAAIPFHAGRRPYEQIAFQFSHHVANADGSIAHQGQWLNTIPGKFPNFEFVRALKKELENDEGTIFRYATHENTILNAIHNQLMESTEPDKDDLCAWIKTITQSTSSSVEYWKGMRNMVDLCELVQKFYFHPVTCGSNSIKQILPAILQESKFLQYKYSKAIYGNEIPSLNFNDHIWIKYDSNGEVVNQYKILEPIFKNVDEALLDELITDNEAELRDGGAAMTAYCQMQFTQMSGPERKCYQNALLKYCELDTLAMVMIWEDWKKIIYK